MMTCKIKDFAFGAFNSHPTWSHTILQVQALDPREEADLAELESLSCNRQVMEILSCRQLKFAVPARFQIVRGPERGRVDRHTLAFAESPSPEGRIPIRLLGEVDQEQTDALLRLEEPGLCDRQIVHDSLNMCSEDSESLAPLPYRRAFSDIGIRRAFAMPLLPGEVQQTILRVIPAEGQNKAAYAVRIDHWAESSDLALTPRQRLERRAFIGSFTALFLVPHSPF